MPVVERTLGTEVPFEAMVITNRDIMKNSINHTEPEHKMHSLTVDIIYRYKTG
jgi:predicted small metal-binding protein